jgi:hypothetical protein
MPASTRHPTFAMRHEAMNGIMNDIQDIMSIFRAMGMTFIQD